MASKRAEHIRQILENPLLKTQPLGEMLYSHLSPKAAQAALANKVKGVQGRSLNLEEEERIVAELQNLADLIYTLLPKKE